MGVPRVLMRTLRWLSEACRLLVADLSFISLRLVLPPVFPNLEADAEAVVLVKPQFEAGRDDVGEGGIVRDPAVHERVLRELWDFFCTTDMQPRAWMESPIRGGEGNREFLFHLCRRGGAGVFLAEPAAG